MDNRILSVLLSMLMVSMAAAGCLGGDDDDTTPTDVEGCTDSTATNYNPDATVDDASCVLPPVTGCMDSEASNYDAAAVEDDGSCTYSLTVWHSYALDSDEEVAFNNVIAAFEASHTNYNLDVQYVPFDDLKPQYVTAAQAGEELIQVTAGRLITRIERVHVVRCEFEFAGLDGLLKGCFAEFIFSAGD